MDSVAYIVSEELYLCIDTMAVYRGRHEFYFRNFDIEELLCSTIV